MEEECQAVVYYQNLYCYFRSMLIDNYHVSENLHLSFFLFAIMTSHTIIIAVPKINTTIETVTPAATAAVLTLSLLLSPIKKY